MKTKNYLLVIAFVIASITSTKAQDATNDATWEETIDFINKNSSYFGNDSFEIVNNRTLKRRSDYPPNDVHGDLTFRYTADLSQLVRVSDYRFELTFTSASYQQVTMNGEDRPLRQYGMGVANSEMKPRLTKAFKHLAYLATKKREEKRKSSGEKF